MSPEEIVADLNATWEPCSVLLGARALAWEPERRELTMSFTADERFCHTGGTVLQGGFSTSMLDATMAYAALCADRAIADLPTLEIKVSFIAPGRPGSFVCRARPVRLGGSVGFLEAELHQDGALVATATSTVRLIRRKA